MGRNEMGGLDSKPASYNQIAGHSAERLAALSDGIFAVAMTLLVLDLHNPVKEAILTEAGLRRSLIAMAPQMTTYLMSFLTLGIFWNGQQAQLNHLARANRHLTWVHITFLFAISMMPFSTRLLSEFITYKTALLCYWGNILILGMVPYVSWRCAAQGGLRKDGTPPDVSTAINRRIVIAQALYAFGALLCLEDTYASIGFIVLVQLNFAFAPRLGFLSRF
jgi:uncharacterized membrane protein